MLARKFGVSLLLLFGLISSAGVAQISPGTSFVEDIDATVVELLDTYSVPGAAIAVIDSGRVVHIKSYGVEDYDTGAPVTNKTRFRIGSISKTFTAWGVMSLVEDGLVDLEAPIDTYLTRWKIPPSQYDATRVNIRRLLSHTAGTSVEYYDGYLEDEPLPSLVELLNGKYREEEKVVLIQAPGVKWTYSGGGYSVVELAVEDITGDTFKDYMQRSTLDPLGLNNTTFDQDSPSATPYDALGTPVEPMRFPALASGGMYSTIEDLSRFAVASLGETGKMQQSVTLSIDSILEMQSPANDTRGGYGLGYSTRLTPEGDAVIGHGAVLEGWHANFAVMPARGKGIVILTNSSSGGNVSTAIRCKWYADIMGPVPQASCNTDIAAVLVKPLKEEGVDAAIEMYRELSTRFDQYHIDEWQLNGLGYDLINAGRLDDAIRIFELNVEYFPNASNPHDSLAEAYLEAGRTEDAVTHFKKSLELDPENQNAITMLQRLGK